MNKLVQELLADSGTNRISVAVHGDHPSTHVSIEIPDNSSADETRRANAAYLVHLLTGTGDGDGRIILRSETDEWDNEVDMPISEISVFDFQKGVDRTFAYVRRTADVVAKIMTTCACCGEPIEPELAVRYV